MKCKTCGRNADSEYCFQHKRRKSLSVSKKGIDKDKLENMRSFFLSIWNKKVHNCENCNKWLGNEPLTYMFDHLLEKSKYPELMYEKENIMLVCLDCHNNKTNGIISKIVKNRIEIVRIKFGK